MNETTSDHFGLVLELVELEQGSKPLKYFNSWLQCVDFHQCFKEAWGGQYESSSMYQLFLKIAIVKFAMKVWARNKGNLETQSHVITRNLHAIVERWWTDNNAHNQEECTRLKELLEEFQTREQLDC